MATPKFIKEYRGLAFSFDELITLGDIGPMGAISQAIYAPGHDGSWLGLAHFEAPALESELKAKPKPKQKSKKSTGKGKTKEEKYHPPTLFEHAVADAVATARERDEWSNRRFRALLSEKDCFVIGGTELIRQFGILPGWLRDGDARDEAKALIRNRGWDVLLRSLRGKENEKGKSFSLMGVKDITKYFAALPPPIDRPVPEDSDETLSPVNTLRGLTLRLRKAIELIVLIEVVLKRRFEMKPPRSVDRFETVSGLPAAEARAAYVWDHLWIEPILFVVTPTPKRIDVERMVAAEIRSGGFEAATGEGANILYRILYGAPCSRAICEAAADVCNRFYGTKPIIGPAPLDAPTPTIAATVRPNEYDQRKALLTTVNPEIGSYRIPEDALGAYEDLLKPGVIAPSPIAADESQAAAADKT